MRSSPIIRVVFINHTAELGGGEIALLELIRNVDALRIEPIVLLFADGPLAPLLREKAEVHILPLSSTLLKANKDRLGVRSMLRGGSVVAGLVFLARLYRRLRDLHPDIVYTNSLKSDLLGGIAGRLAGVSVVWHIRDRIAPDYLPRKVVSAFRALARVIPNFIVANSFSTLSTLHLPDCSDEAAPRPQACVVHDGVDLQRFRPKLSTGTAERVTVGLIGRISPWKGQAIFLEAIRLLPAPHSLARFQIIGSAVFGEVEYERRILKMLQQPDLAGIAECTGFEPDIPRRINELDIVIHASTLPEPFGQVVIEGMAAGKPVIATRGGGIPEIVVDNVTGILVPMGNAQALADAIARLLGDEALRQAMGAAARTRVQQCFPIAKTARAVEKLLFALVRTSESPVAGQQEGTLVLPESFR